MECLERGESQGERGEGNTEIESEEEERKLEKGRERKGWRK